MKDVLCRYFETVQVMLDVFAGTNSTAKACILLDRRRQVYMTRMLLVSKSLCQALPASVRGIC